MLDDAPLLLKVLVGLRSAAVLLEAGKCRAANVADDAAVVFPLADHVL